MITLVITYPTSGQSQIRKNSLKCQMRSEYLAEDSQNSKNRKMKNLNL